MRASARDVYELKLQELQLDECQQKLAELPIEGLIVECTKERKFDIGALCYQSRTKTTRSLIKTVDFHTLRPERISAVRTWVAQQVTFYYTHNTANTIYTNATKISGIFDWADSSGFEDFLETPEKYHQALQAYTQNLLWQIEIKNKSKATANSLQSVALRSGYILFPNTAFNFQDDLPIISSKGGFFKPTEPPLQSEIEAYLTPCQYLFDGLTDFVLSFKKFPAQTPFMTEHLWLLPGEYPFISKVVFSKNTKAQSYISWDYENGRIREMREAEKLSRRPLKHVQADLVAANVLKYEANHDQRHEKRMRLAKIAHDSFLPLFVANSGINEQPLRDLLFDESYETFESEQKGFIGIKMRSGGKKVKFSIKKTFTKQFDKFIRLRKFIDNEENNKYLFIGMTINEKSIGGQISLGEITKLNDRIRRFLIPNFKGLSYQKLRKYKSNYLLTQGNSVQVVSSLLQSSEKTILKSYAQANENTAIAEISAMMKRLVNLLNDYSGEETPAGDCADISQRSEEVSPPPDYEPNCKNFEGCIFCSQFRTHANEPSIRKLLSMRFVTLEYLNSCADKNHFNEVHGAAVTQIDRIISELREQHPDMTRLVDQISLEITNEFKLSDYWKRFYHRMVQLKVMK